MMRPFDEGAAVVDAEHECAPVLQGLVTRTIVGIGSVLCAAVNSFMS